MRIARADEASLIEAADFLSRGRLVAFPTETVFGLGCDASNKDAVERLYRVKGRARSNPLIVHVSGVEQAESWGVLCSRAGLLARRFLGWGIDFSCSVSKCAFCASRCCDGYGECCVACSFARSRAPVVVASVWQSDCCAERESFGLCERDSCGACYFCVFGSEEPALVLDSSDVCEAGIESTVVSFMGSGEGCVLRLGAVSVAEMEEVLGEKLSRVGDRDGDERGVSCRLSPGLSGSSLCS